MNRCATVALLMLLSCAGGSSEGPAAGPALPAACTPQALAFDTDDAEEIVAALAADFASAGGIDAWAEENGRKPWVRMVKYRNKTAEAIDLESLGHALQKAMAATGKVELLAAGPGLSAIHAEQDAGAPMGNERGADLVGTMDLISADEATPAELVRMYSAYVTLTGIDLTKRWVGEHRVQKMCELPAPPAE